MIASPYVGRRLDRWEAITRRLIGRHPASDLLRPSVEAAWEAIFHSRIGRLRIGKDVLPQPQIMGFFLHELIPVELRTRQAGWERGTGLQKDAHFEPDPKFSFEIKTSSSSRTIFGNRSYAQPTVTSGKEKSGFLLAVNFEKFSGQGRPAITRVRFGWLDHSDWIPQTAATGQQAHLSADADRFKLVDL